MSFIDTYKYIVFSSGNSGSGTSTKPKEKDFSKIFPQLCFSDAEGELSHSLFFSMGIYIGLILFYHTF